MVTSKKMRLFCYILTIIFFVIFAYDLENDRDMWTWIWLGTCYISWNNYKYFNKIKES